MAERHEIVSAPFTVTLIKIKARQMCRRSDFSRSDCEDLQQDMRVHLLEKAHLFDPARGSLEAFVSRTLNNWAAMRMRYRSRQKRCEGLKAVSLERTPVECEGEITTLGAVLLEEDGRRLTATSSISHTEQIEQRDAVDFAMRGLTAEDRALLAQVAEQGITATAEAMGVSWRQVNNAMVRIREHFEKAGLGSD